MICKKCGQDHHKAIQCIGGKGGKAPKHEEAQRANANKRWAAWRAAKSQPEAGTNQPE